MLLTLRGTPVPLPGRRDRPDRRSDRARGRCSTRWALRFWPLLQGPRRRADPDALGGGPGGGFTAPGVRPWLPMADPAACNVADQEGDPDLGARAVPAGHRGPARPATTWPSAPTGRSPRPRAPGPSGGATDHGAAQHVGRDRRPSTARRARSRVATDRLGGIERGGGPDPAAVERRRRRDVTAGAAPAAAALRAVHHAGPGPHGAAAGPGPVGWPATATRSCSSPPRTTANAVEAHRRPFVPFAPEYDAHDLMVANPERESSSKPRRAGRQGRSAADLRRADPRPAPRLRAILDGFPADCIVVDTMFLGALPLALGPRAPARRWPASG